jgi:hypothetical protein
MRKRHQQAEQNARHGEQERLDQQQLDQHVLPHALRAQHAVLVRLLLDVRQQQRVDQHRAEADQHDGGERENLVEKQAHKVERAHRRRQRRLHRDRLAVADRVAHDVGEVDHVDVDRVLGADVRLQAVGVHADHGQRVVVDLKVLGALEPARHLREQVLHARVGDVQRELGREPQRRALQRAHRADQVGDRRRDQRVQKVALDHHHVAERLRELAVGRVEVVYHGQVAPQHERLAHRLPRQIDQRAD